MELEKLGFRTVVFLTYGRTKQNCNVPVFEYGTLKIYVTYAHNKELDIQKKISR